MSFDTYLSARIEAARHASSIWDDSGRPPRTRGAHYPETRRADSNRLSRNRVSAPAASCDPTRHVPLLEKKRELTEESRLREKPAA